MSESQNRADSRIVEVVKDSILRESLYAVEVVAIRESIDGVRGSGP